MILGGNLFWGMRFHTCKNFWTFANHHFSLTPKNSYKYKSHTAITSIVDSTQSVESRKNLVIMSKAKNLNLKNSPSLAEGAREQVKTPSLRGESLDLPKQSTKSTHKSSKNESTKCGFIAIIGRPNAGKSTLLNALINENIALTSHKVNATRKQNNIIVMQDNAQMIFIDTPGLHHNQKLLNQFMIEETQKAMESCDIIAFINGVNDNIKHYEDFLELNKKYNKKHILLLNKIDLIDKNSLLKTLKRYEKYSKYYESLIPISCNKGINLTQILNEIAKLLPDSVHFYDSDIITSSNLREIYREKIRESLFAFTNKEIPYESEVLIKKIDESENLTKIYAQIITQKDSQKKIIIGTKGKSIKNIGINARKKIEEISETKVFLSLEVVTQKGWSKDKMKLKMIMEQM